jgi:hypothetical protein
MRDQLGPEAEETPPRRDIAHRLRAIERWRQHSDDELLYTPDALSEAAAPPSREARYYHCWGAGGLGGWMPFTALSLPHCFCSAPGPGDCDVWPRPCNSGRLERGALEEIVSPVTARASPHFPPNPAQGVC